MDEATRRYYNESGAFLTRQLQRSREYVLYIDNMAIVVRSGAHIAGKAITAGLH